MENCPSVVSSLKESATHKLTLRFFDLDIEISSDSDAHVDLFARMYRRFLTEGSPATLQPPPQFILQTRPDNPWGKPVLSLDGEVWPVDDPRMLNGYFYDCILNAIIARVRSHFLIHAGVVGRQGRGIILAGDGSHGKTTLVLELVRRGFKFLSDEMAALGRADHRVHPFPRSLRIEPGTLELTGFGKAGADAPVWIGKLLLDIEEIQPGSLGQPATIDTVIILRDPTETDEDTPSGPERELGVFVNRLNDTLLDAVRRIEGVTRVHTAVERGYLLIRLSASQRMRVLSQIEAICQEQRVLILDISKRVERHPTFGAPAQLEPIPSSQAVIELLRRFQGGHKSALLQEEFGGSAARLFLELAETIGQASCFQLFVGPLHDAADLVCSLINSPSG